MKRIISLLLALLMLMSVLPHTLAAEKAETCTIQVLHASQENPQKIECRNVDRAVYLKAEDVADLADATLLTHGDIIRFQQSINIFEPTFLKETEKTGKTTYWVPAAETLEKLNHSVRYIQGCLMVEPWNSRTKELEDAAKEIFGEQIQRVALTSTKGMAGDLAMQAGILYHAFSEGDFLGVVSGKYTTDNYKEAIALLLTSKEKDDHGKLMEALESGNGINENLQKIEDFTFGQQTLTQFLNQNDTGDITAGRVLRKTYSSISNAVDHILSKESEETDISQELHFSGFSFNDQIKILQYLRSCADTYSYYVDAMDSMMVTTPLEDPYDWGPISMVDAAKNVVSFYQSETAQEILQEFIDQEIDAILFETAQSGTTKLLEETLKMKNLSRNVAVSKILLETIYAYFGFPLTEVMHSVELDFCLRNIQDAAKNLYYHYIDELQDPIRAKSALIIYLRCSEVWADLYEPHVSEGKFDAFRDLVEKYKTNVALIDNASLTESIQNPEIPYHAMITDGPAILEEERWDNLVDFITESGSYRYLTRIETHSDGTMELMGGFPDAETDEYYKGTYVQEKGNVYRIKIIGGMNEITGGGYEQKIYDALIRLTVFDGTLYAEHLTGDRHWFFTDQSADVYNDKTFDNVPEDMNYSNYILNFDPEDIKHIPSGINGKWICKIPREDGGPYVHVLTFYDGMQLEVTGGKDLAHLTDDYSGTYFSYPDGVVEVKLNGTGQKDPEYTMRRLIMNFYTNQENTLLKTEFVEGDPHWIFEGEPKLFVREGMDIYEATRPEPMQAMMLPQPKDDTKTQAVLKSPKKNYQYGPISFEAPADLQQKQMDYLYLTGENVRVEIEKLEGLARETTLKKHAQKLCDTYQGSELTAYGNWYYYIHSTGSNVSSRNYFCYTTLIQQGDDMYLINYSGMELGKEAFLGFLKTLKTNE